MAFLEKIIFKIMGSSLIILLIINIKNPSVKTNGFLCIHINFNYYLKNIGKMPSISVLIIYRWVFIN